METDQIVAEVKEPASEEFKCELAKLYPALLQFTTKLHSGNSHKGEDLASEVIIRAIDHAHGFTMGTNLKAWLFIIARNAFYSSKRRDWRQQEFPEGNAEFMPIEKLKIAPTADVIAELKEALRAVDLLYGNQREAFNLIVFEELSYEEAASLLDMSIGTVKSAVNRARSQIFTYMGIKNNKVRENGSNAALRPEVDE